jgi:A/G-specific adenine glycosylase
VPLLEARGGYVSRVVNAGDLARWRAIRLRLRNWFRVHARDLPWRRTRDPYAVMVSEFMLQQTTVSAVIPFFQRWMERFPDVASLASSSEQEVLALWQGLGYYSRARNLRLAAQAIMGNHGGRVPPEPEKLLELPGFGTYTAAAVAAFAFDRPVAVVDANVTRVLARLENVLEPVDAAAGRAAVLRAAAVLLPRQGGREHAGALMELGALICVPKIPRCGICPVRSQCRAKQPSELPRKAPRKKVTVCSEERLWVRRGRKIGLIQGRGTRWKGLWQLPVGSEGTRVLHESVYSITRYRVTLRVHAARKVPAGVKFFDGENLPPMPSPHARVVAALLSRVHNGL